MIPPALATLGTLEEWEDGSATGWLIIAWVGILAVDMANRLVDSASTYLRQHAENPVDWVEWGSEAWDRARRENKPVFLSVGYSSCHWCHVMAHESFEDEEVAAALNRSFVCIKLDREERPDVDDLYMTAVQLVNGHGGWPMSVFLTPDQEPFFAGTYYPKHGRGGHPGFLQIVNALGDAWREEEAEIRAKAGEFRDGLRQVLERTIPAAGGKIDVGMIDAAVGAMRSDFDEAHGGFGGAPKFPPFGVLRFLLRYCEVRSVLPGVGLAEEAAYMALRTLESMALGGIRDHVGGGFHRYATDERWFLPHFEKMLTDNAQMLWLYSRASRMVDDEELRGLFEEVADGIVSWLEREMRIGDVYAASLDADSGGHEGTTYLWGFDEVSESVVGVYGFERHGNAYDEATGQSTGRNILHRQSVGLRLEELDEMLIRRLEREQPERDDLCLTFGNALAVSGLIEAGRRDLAERVAAALVRPDHLVEHRLGGGEAFLDGYAALADALIDLGWEADGVINRMVDQFADNRGFWYCGRDHERLIGQSKPNLDSAVPSGNGLAMRVLRRSGRSAEALEHLTAAYGWAQRAPQSASTVLLECLEHLVEGRALEGTGQVGEVVVELSPDVWEVREDGWCYGTLTLRIPNGFHVNSTDPGADWLVPLLVAVEGAYGEASYPPSSTGRLEGEASVDLRIRPKGVSREFDVFVRYQVCSDRECFLAAEQVVKGRLG
jgi:hypothetical protein